MLIVRGAAASGGAIREMAQIGILERATTKLSLMAKMRRITQPSPTQPTPTPT